MPTTPNSAVPTSASQSTSIPPQTQSAPTNTIEITSSSGGIDYQQPVPLSTASSSEQITSTEDQGKSVNTILTVVLIVMVLGVIGAIVWLIKPWEPGFSFSDTFNAIKEIF